MYKDEIYTKNKDNFTYWSKKESNTLQIDTYDLNKEIRIIEEDKILKKMIMPSISFNLGFIDTSNKEIVIEEMNKTIQDLYDRTVNLNTQINEIIDEVNKLKKENK